MKKFITREVKIGTVLIGKDNPICIQSMTNTKTEDTLATLNQILALEQCGCAIARVTVQGKKQAYALEKLKNELIKKGCNIPIVADIHFYPPAAFIAADFVDKIRINPGNFAEKRAVFQQKPLTDTQYENELLKIEEKLFLLIEKLKKNKVALRIGTNHGSLSDRIMTKYGDTINAMVVSAVEYTNICRKYDFHELVFSMKSSSSFVTIEAYRALVKDMLKLGWDYPLHLGVTEAGDLEDGIIKSSVGIGALLLDGIGDTIRVSLTTNPTNEIAPAKRLVELTHSYKREQAIKACYESSSLLSNTNKAHLAIKIDKNFKIDEKSLMADIFYLQSDNLGLIEKLKKQNKILISKLDLKDVIRVYSLENIPKNITEKYVLEVSTNDDLKLLKTLKKPYFIIFKPENSDLDKIQDFFNFLKEYKLDIPILLNLKYDQDLENLKILASSQIGLLLFEKQILGILLETKFDDLDISLNILQACNLKRFKTEFIACPGCGRTLFNLQKTLKEIKDETSHLKDIKIAIMGCIVNGPGEMQDADFGYVGSGDNSVDLYVNKKCVEKNIDEKDAVDKLITLIKRNNKWKEPSNCL